MEGVSLYIIVVSVCGGDWEELLDEDTVAGTKVKEDVRLGKEA